MAAQLGWQQKWSTALGWADAWSDGWPLADLTVGSMAGRMTIQQTGLVIHIRKDLGDLTITLSGRSQITANPVPITPEDFALGSLFLTMRGAVTMVNGGMDSVDPLWIDPSILLPMSARMSFGPVTIARVLEKQLSSTQIVAAGRMSFEKPTVINYTISKQLGAVTLNMIGSVNMLADMFIRSGTAFALGDLSIELVGRTQTVGDPFSILPPFDLGDVELTLTGRTTVSTLRISSGGPISIGAPILLMSARTGVMTSMSFPPFDAGSEVRSVVDQSVTSIVAKVEPDSLSLS